MTKVYVVTRGEYSDYRIVAIFSTKELAQQLADELDNSKRYGEDAKVEEWSLDKHVPTNYIYKVVYNDIKDKWTCNIEEPDAEEIEAIANYEKPLIICNGVTIEKKHEYYTYEPEWEPGTSPYWEHKTIPHNPYKEYTVYINEPDRDRALKIGMEKILQKVAK
jgi:hypothetical protein